MKAGFEYLAPLRVIARPAARIGHKPKDLQSTPLGGADQAAIVRRQNIFAAPSEKAVALIA